MTANTTLRTVEELIDRLNENGGACYQEHAKLVRRFFSRELAAIRAETREECAAELESAFEEASTYNLLHGAARIRALSDAKGQTKAVPQDCPHPWTRAEPQPAKFTCSCGTVVYRSYEDYADD